MLHRIDSVAHSTPYVIEENLRYKHWQPELTHQRKYEFMFLI